MKHTFFFDPESETQAPEEIRQRQDERLKVVLEEVFHKSRFYRAKMSAAGWTTAPTTTELTDLPFTTKAELVQDAQDHPPYGTNLTQPLERYLRVHQTSGTTGRPLMVLDTRESWEAWKRSWCMIYRAAGIGEGDCIFVAFSFGPFVGFWSAFEAGVDLGCRMISGGGMTSLQRLDSLFRHQATVLVSTPSYALHLAEVAAREGLDLSSGPVRTTVQAGEIGASIPSTRKRIERLWGARCFDHVGASEVGPFGFECHLRRGLHIDERNYIVECIDPVSLQPCGPGTAGELVLTNLNRNGFPVIRYRTGDLVRLAPPQHCPCGRYFRLVSGGVLGRIDDMITIRGINIYPSSLEAIVREFEEILEFEVRVDRSQSLAELSLQVELSSSGSERREQVRRRLENGLRTRIGLRIPVSLAKPNSLPRYELKAKRFKVLPG